MGNYILRKLFSLIFTLWFVVTLIFFLIRSVPGGPAYTALGQFATAESVKALEKKWGLDKPIMIQYFTFLKKIAKGDLGNAMITNAPISKEIKEALPYTIELTFAGMLIGVSVGVPLGILTALRRNSLIDYAGRILSLIGLSIPEFFLGVLMIFIFSVKLHIFPAMGGGELNNFASRIKYLFLPAFTLGMIMISFISRMARSSILNVLREDYLRTARAKGLSEFVVIYKHALRNALIPIITLIGLYFAILIGGAVLTEMVFSRPGLGKMLIFSIRDHDYITLQSSVIIFSSLVFIINTLTDILYALIDPRIRR